MRFINEVIAEINFPPRRAASYFCVERKQQLSGSIE